MALQWLDEFLSFHAFDFAPAKNFIKKKPPRPRRRPGAPGARLCEPQHRQTASRQV
jgi:hypothetical protein